MKKSKRNRIIAITAALFLTAVIIWVFWANTALELNVYVVSGKDIPESFDGFRIVHVSDLHNSETGENNTVLLDLIKIAAPDIIAITGDTVDSRRTDLDIAVDFAKEAVKTAPCYFVTGNHESRIPEYEELKKELKALGVHVLEDEKITIENEGSSITLIGLNDPTFTVDRSTDSKLNELIEEDDGYTVLLSHRPELFDVYVSHGIDLTLSGHAHGGQFRLPFIGGFFAPNQGFFPKYDGGMYTKEQSAMIVSRGIGNSLFPLRFNNRPEVILIELAQAE